MKKYRFNLPHKLEIMGFVFQEFNNFYKQGKLKEKESNEIIMSNETIEKARRSVERMAEIGR